MIDDRRKPSEPPPRASDDVQILVGEGSTPARRRASRRLRVPNDPVPRAADNGDGLVADGRATEPDLTAAASSAAAAPPPEPVPPRRASVRPPPGGVPGTLSPTPRKSVPPPPGGVPGTAGARSSIPPDDGVNMVRQVKRKIRSVGDGEAPQMPRRSDPELVPAPAEAALDATPQARASVPDLAIPPPPPVLSDGTDDFVVPPTDSLPPPSIEFSTSEPPPEPEVKPEPQRTARVSIPPPPPPAAYAAAEGRVSAPAPAVTVTVRAPTPAEGLDITEVSVDDGPADDGPALDVGGVEHVDEPTMEITIVEEPLGAASSAPPPTPRPPKATMPDLSRAKPPPTPPKSAEPSRDKPAEKPEGRKRRPWWEALFNDDYFRTMPRYTADQTRREAEFIEASLGVEKGAVVLDLACGHGRQAIELAARGYEVIALDLSLSMLSRAMDDAQDRGAKLNFLHSDMREMEFNETFDAAYCVGTSFGYFDDEKNAEVIHRLRRALKVGGTLLLDVVNRDYVIQSVPSMNWYEGDGAICMEETAFNFITSRLTVKRTMLFDGAQRELEYSIRLYSLHELGKLLHDAGFKIVEVSGHPATAGAFFGPNSRQLIILAQKRAPEPGDTARAQSNPAPPATQT